MINRIIVIATNHTHKKANKYNCISMMLIIKVTCFMLSPTSEVILFKVYLSSKLSDKAKIVINASEEKLGMIIEDF